MDVRFDLTLVTQELENGNRLGEALFFPEATRFGRDAANVHRALCDIAGQIVSKSKAIELHRRFGGDDLRVEEVLLSIAPPRDSFTWLRPIELRFDVLRWERDEARRIAYVPALGIEVVLRPTDDLVERVRVEIEGALARRGARELGLSLVVLQRATKTEVGRFAITRKLPTLRQRVIRDEEARDPQPRVLINATTELEPTVMPRAYEIDETADRLAELLRAVPPQSLVLVGKPGCGKTAAVLEVVRRRRELALEKTRFFQTSGSGLVAGQCGYGAWQERCLQLVKEVSEIRGILVLGGLVELVESGKGGGIQQGIASFLKPSIERGDVVVIVECTADEYAAAERDEPQLLGLLQRVEIDEPTPRRARRILERVASRLGVELGIQVDDKALDRIDALHRRYATYSAYPGRPLRFLRNLARDAIDTELLLEEDAVAAFSRETGLPRLMLDDAVALDGESTSSWFRERLIGQDDAVRLIVDAIRRVKARVTRPARPIASFLFIGPTGVGKTEMAKTLAECLFSSRDRLVRIDMSEFADPSATERLLGGVTSSEGRLTAPVRDQPFSVILLDEFEKADPAVFDLLLQLLGEGRLTDSRGRVADYSNAIVIMTSNLGAETYQRGRAGFPVADDGRESATNHFTEAVRDFLRPEIFNRIDSIVPFLPLGRDSILAIARREIDAVRRRDGILSRAVELDVSEGALEHIARVGFDPLHGARPLKRALEHELLAPLAERLNRSSHDLPVVARAEMKGGELRVSARATASRSPADERHRNDARDVTTRCASVRRALQAVAAHPTLVNLANELYRLGLEAARRTGRLREKRRGATGAASGASWIPAREDPRRRRIHAILDELQSMERNAAELEDEILLDFFARNSEAVMARDSDVVALQDRFDTWIIDAHEIDATEPELVTVVLYSESSSALFDLARAYADSLPEHALRGLRQYRVTSSSGVDAKRTVRAASESFELSAGTWSEIREMIDGGERHAAVRMFREVTAAGGGEGWSLALAEEALRGDLAVTNWSGFEARGVADPARFLRSPKNSAAAIGLEISMPRGASLYGSETGLHVVRRGSTKPRVWVDARPESSLDQIIPPAGFERRGAFSDRKPRRTYDVDQGRVEDREFGLKMRLDGEWGRSIAALVERALVRRAMEALGL